MKNNERPSPVKVGEKLRNLRKKKGLTLKKLSEKAELSIGYLSNLERDACSPTLENIQKICGILDVSLSELLEENIESRTVIKKMNVRLFLKKKGLSVTNPLCLARMRWRDCVSHWSLIQNMTPRTGCITMMK